jgi:tetratricopeptide (TPR) repeat protein
MLRALFVCTLFASSASALVVSERPAFAKKEKENAAKARERFEDGKKAYNLGEFDKAIDFWKEGYDLKADPIFLFNIAQAYRQKSEYAKSVFFYKAYLREAPDAKNRADVEARIVELQKLVDAGTTQSDAPPRGFGDLGTGEGGTIGTTTTDTTATDTTATDTTATDTTATDTTTDTEPEPDSDTTATEEERPVADNVDRPHPGRGLKIGGMVTGGVGVALVVTGIVFAMKASSLQGELEDAVAMGTPWNSDLDAKRSDGKSAATMGKVTIGLGVAAIVGGGVMYFLGMKKDKAAASGESAWMIVPAVSPAGGGVLVRFDY